MLNLHRDKKIVRHKPGKDGKILSDHRQDGNSEAHRHLVRRKKTKSPPPQNISLRNLCATGMPDSNVAKAVLEPTLFPPLSFVLGENEFVGNPPSRSECRIGTPLVAAALAPGLLKHGK